MSYRLTQRLSPMLSPKSRKLIWQNTRVLHPLDIRVISPPIKYGRLPRKGESIRDVIIKEEGNIRSFAGVSQNHTQFLMAEMDSHVPVSGHQLYSAQPETTGTKPSRVGMWIFTTLVASVTKLLVVDDGKVGIFRDQFSLTSHDYLSVQIVTGVSDGARWIELSHLMIVEDATLAQRGLLEQRPNVLPHTLFIVLWSIVLQDCFGNWSFVLIWHGYYVPMSIAVPGCIRLKWELMPFAWCEYDCQVAFCVKSR